MVKGKSSIILKSKSVSQSVSGKHLKSAKGQSKTERQRQRKIKVKVKGWYLLSCHSLVFSSSLRRGGALLIPSFPGQASVQLNTTTLQLLPLQSSTTSYHHNTPSTTNLCDDKREASPGLFLFCHNNTTDCINISILCPALHSTYGPPASLPCICVISLGEP